MFMPSLLAVEVESTVCMTDNSSTDSNPKRLRRHTE